MVTRLVRDELKEDEGSIELGFEGHLGIVEAGGFQEMGVAGVIGEGGFHGCLRAFLEILILGIDRDADFECGEGGFDLTVFAPGIRDQADGGDGSHFGIGRKLLEQGECGLTVLRQGRGVLDPEVNGLVGRFLE